MDRKQAKKERTRRFFLDAAKGIIRAEGVDSLTTKKIGEKAAYSYASIYNYFENFNGLVCECLEELARESADWVAARIKGETPAERVVDFARLMIEANAREPNVYSVFLSTNIDYGYFARRDGRPFVHPAYPLLLAELERFPELSSGGERGEARVLADILTYVFHSKLHFYIRYGTPTSLKRLHAEVEEEVRFILDRVGRRR
ncbi:MAG TPA: TetR/AcrR family transcriptional regulator [Spirochaetales bacterium]|nr:TetR/AcrR family transcriptional regulator [Spirochaetales bacterium]